SSRRRHTRFSRDWSSDVCSSDLDDFNRLTVSDSALALRLFLTASAQQCGFGKTFGTHTLEGGGRNIAVEIGAQDTHVDDIDTQRSEERRVGKECRSRRGTYR